MEQPAQGADPFGERRVFAVLGTLPEPGGYGIAKFSRSSRPYQEWIMELTQEGAERFYQTFYFDYGHASIADLAHLTVVVENISMVAAEALWDEPLVDGQASSTRYQDFKVRGFHLPEELAGQPLEAPFRRLCQRLIEEYGAFHRQLLAHLMEKHRDERPPEMDDARYERTLRARTFDVARYLLPMAVRTGLGQVLNARTLERQLVRLLSDPLREIRAIGGELKAAVTERPAFNPTAERLRPLLEELEGRLTQEEGVGELLEEVRRVAGFGAPAAPTLVRYAQPSPYINKVREALAELAARYGPRLGEPDGARGVALADPHDPETECAATLLYRALPHSYAQILPLAEAMDPGERREIVALAHRGRTRHDPALYELRTGYRLIFDLCLDCGAWRDFHRHRRLVQINKGFRPGYGFDTPKEMEEAGLGERYRKLMEEAGQLAGRVEAEHPGVGQYALPFAFRRRALLKMDAEELQYIAELRTRPENHFSVREIAHGMHEAFRGRYPRLAEHIHPVPPEQEEFFKR